MATKYTKISEGMDARVHNGALYVRLTGIRLGMLVQGDYSGRVYRMPYTGTIDQAITGEYPAVMRALDPNHGEVIAQGNLIQ